MKTADLQRSKRLKELGWDQDSLFCWVEIHNKWVFWYWKEMALHQQMEAQNKKEILLPEYYLSPTAGEMIEWLLGEGKCFLEIDEFGITCNYIKANRMRQFDFDDGIENALADACAWVLERKI